MNRVVEDASSPARVRSKPGARVAHAKASIDHLAVLVRKHPYVSLAGVAAAGIALGGVFGSRYGRLAVAILGGFSLHKILDDAVGNGGLRELLRTQLGVPLPAPDTAR